MARPSLPESKKEKAKPRGSRIKKLGTVRITRSVAEQLKAASEANKNSPVLCLPGEIRNLIYEYALGDKYIWPVVTLCGIRELRASPYGDFEDDKATVKDWENLFNLSLVSRQLNQETRLLPYKLNVFRGPAHLDFDGFLSRLSQEKKSAITVVSLGCAPLCYKKHCRVNPVPTEFVECTGLKTIMCMCLLSDRLKGLVKDYAQERGLAFIDEDTDVLPWGTCESYCIDYDSDVDFDCSSI